MNTYDRVYIPYLQATEAVEVHEVRHPHGYQHRYHTPPKATSTLLPDDPRESTKDPRATGTRTFFRQLVVNLFCSFHAAAEGGGAL